MDPEAAIEMAHSNGSLAVELAGVRFANPFVLASGIIGTHASLMERAARAGAGAVTAKSAGPRPRRGHPNPSCFDFGEGLLNAIGLANPGAADEASLLRETAELLRPMGVPLIASVFGGTAAEFARAAERVAAARPDMIELNISCPNVGSEFGEPFAGDPASAGAVTSAVRKVVDIPIIVKLAPNVPDIGRIAVAVVDGGADAICAINTMPGMAIDPESGVPVLSNGAGGVSGGALRPIAVLAVYQVRAAVDVPIIGTGGVSTVEHAIELFSAGADAIGVGSAVYRHGPDVFGHLRVDLAAWLAERSLTLDEVKGRAHRVPVWPERPSEPPVPLAHN
jgi:dihydroorotate dehydrogenase (NAD+) catalytic subunit